MQLTGSRFTETSALAGNDVATLPDFPAEIRAPAGSLGGVSGFQIQFASEDIYTAGDQPDVLIAMNPAALARNVDALRSGAIVVVDDGAFTDRGLARAGYDSNPLEDGSLESFDVKEVPIERLTIEALSDIGELTKKEKGRCKNFFALGITFWMFGRSLDDTLTWIGRKFAKKPALVEANTIALKKGYDFGLTHEFFAVRYNVPRAKIAAGKYRSITGNLAASYGFAVAGQLAERELFLASYPITPASDILHTLSGLKAHGVRTMQMEDEIAAVNAAIGASYGGAIGLTTSSGPGIALKSEAISLAVGAELPLVIVNVQRAGPSTGMPTKVEQADLLQSLFGRHGEAPLVVLAPSSPGDCFHMAIEAVRIATKYMTPVIYLSDAYLANGAEPWQVPDLESLPHIAVPNAEAAEGDEEFLPFARDPQTLARPWAVPGTPGLEHRIGGLEKQDGTGHVSYDPANHQLMSDYREDKIRGIANDIPPLAVEGDVDARVLVLGWGSTYGAIRAAARDVRRHGHKVAYAQLRYLNPMPANTAEVLDRYDRILVPELNHGQLSRVLRGEFLTKIEPFAQITGQPMRSADLVTRIEALLEDV